MNTDNSVWTVELDAKGWPKEMPVLSASNIRKGAMNLSGDHGEMNCHCLMGWIRIACGIKPTPALNMFGPEDPVYMSGTPACKLRSKLQENINNWITVNRPNTFQMSIVSFNDDNHTLKGEIAEIWNTTIRQLGYKHVEDNE